MADGKFKQSQEYRYAVRVDSLSDFALFLERELGVAVDPGVRHIHDDSPHGLNWGDRVRSALVDRTRTGYTASQRGAITNLANYLRAGAVMLEVIERLITTYRTSEEMAALSTEDVLRFFIEVRREADYDEGLLRMRGVPPS